MNQIDLFNKDKQQDSKSQKDPRLEKKRPDKIDVPKLVSQNQKWRECKIIGKNIAIRSYSAACSLDNKLYVYGGYQILNSLLSDFYCIDVNDKLEKFVWQQILPEQQNLPGPRSKHGLVSVKGFIYLIGGLHSDLKASNQIYKFDLDNKKWELLKPIGDSLPCQDSFGSLACQRDGEDVIILVCGYNSEIGDYSNSIYEYNISKNKVSALFQGSTDTQKHPKPRSGLAACTDRKNVYFFGGKDDTARMNDLWLYSLSSCTFQRLEDGGIVPAIRNGHSLIYHENKLYLFGGIHDITWELDDLHIYCFKKKQWSTLEQDSARKKSKKQEVQEKQQKSPANKKTDKSKKKNWYDSSQNLYGNNSLIGNLHVPRNSSHYDEEAHKSMSPGRMIEEKKKKIFFQKKSQLLKAFQISEGEKGRYLDMETSAQAMKNSLDVIGNPDPRRRVPSDKLTDFGKESVSKFLQPLQNNTKIIIGKKPCARDGHCSVVINNELIIFGGDRHQMSFNDIYKLNLVLANKQFGQ